MRLLPLPPPLEAVLKSYYYYLIFLDYAQKIDDVIENPASKLLI
jgi:hypothetical protein